jgi:hypothetical protein
MAPIGQRETRIGAMSAAIEFRKRLFVSQS